MLTLDFGLVRMLTGTLVLYPAAANGHRLGREVTLWARMSASGPILAVSLLSIALW